MHSLYVESHDKVACKGGLIKSVSIIGEKSLKGIENTLISCMQVFDAAHFMPPNAIYTNYIVCTLSTQAINPV